MTGNGVRRATVSCAFCGTLNRIDLERVADRPKCGECARPMLLDRPVTVSDQDLDRVLAGTDVPVLVDFWAVWCAPCKVMAPILDEVARSRTGRALIAKLDTDRSPVMAERFGIRGIPTLILFSGGRELDRAVGAVPRSRVEQLLDSAG
jgi:thioredoxin 2